MLFHNFSGANLKKNSYALPVRTSFLEEQDLIGSNTFFDPDMLHFRLVFITKIIKAQTVYFAVDNICQKCFQCDALSVIQNAFKYRILHSLPVINALPGDLPQAFASGGVLCIYIIGDQYQHSPSLP